MVGIVKQSHPQSHADLKEAILDAWDQIDLAEIQRYCNHINDVLPRIVQSHGIITMYNGIIGVTLLFKNCSLCSIRSYRII